MKHFIIGAGEVGKALWKILKGGILDRHNDPADIGFNLGEMKVEMLHICFPYSQEFEAEVDKYQKIYQPKYTIIHSTVPLGTSRKLGAIHSPIRGIHPHLEEGIRTFPKFIGGEEASEVADHFRKAGIKVILYDEPETTEALKLFDTEYYKVCIEFTKRVKEFCDKNNLSFSEVYTIPNQTYNEGYTKLGMPEVVRPVLQPIMTPIGGHCLEPNSKILKDEEG